MTQPETNEKKKSEKELAQETTRRDKERPQEIRSNLAWAL